jgi:hypothetical protein
MPARKNRPDKCGTSIERSPKVVNEAERKLVDKLVGAERHEPCDDHYVSWPDMTEARQLAKKGYLREGGRALGCFYVTDVFRRTFMR